MYRHKLIAVLVLGTAGCGWVVRVLMNEGRGKRERRKTEK